MARRRYIPAKVRHGVDRYAWRGVAKPCQLELPGIHDPSTWTEYHHRRAYARGGPHTEANLMLLCDACHKWVHVPGGPTRWAIRAGVVLPASPGNRKWRRSEVVAAGLLSAAVVAEAELTGRHSGRA